MATGAAVRTYQRPSFRGARRRRCPDRGRGDPLSDVGARRFRGDDCQLSRRAGPGRGPATLLRDPVRARGDARRPLRALRLSRRRSRACRIRSAMPRLGEIRLQWWLDSLDGALESGGGDAPAVRGAGRRCAAARFPLRPFDALIEARRADLYADPPAEPRRTSSAGSAKRSRRCSSLRRSILGSSGPETADAAGHAGIAYGLCADVWLHFAEDRARGRTIAAARPARRRGSRRGGRFAGTGSAALERVLDTDDGDCLGALWPRAGATSRRCRAALAPAFLPLATTGPLHHPSVPDGRGSRRAKDAHCPIWRASP